MKELILPLTSVVATQAASTDATEAIHGTIYAVEYRPGTMDTNADLTIICTGHAASANTLLVKANAGTSAVWYYPRELMHAVADGAALTGTSGGDRTCPLAHGIVNAAIASAGATTVRTGTVVIYWEPL